MAKERMIDGKYLKELRKSTGLSQKEFSEMLGLNVWSLRAYENNQRMLGASKFRELKQSLGYNLESTKHLRVMIDYLRITFKEVRDLAYFCETYLLCDFKDFISEDTRLMTYNHLYRRGDIWIFDYFDKTETGNYQITVQLSGQGCRQMELLMERANLTWHQLLSKMYYEREDMKVTRLDIAMDEMYRGYENEQEHFLLSDMIAKVYRGEVVFDRLKTWNHIGGGSLENHNQDRDDLSQGISIYFGSRQSNLYFNFYEKRYELARKEEMSLVESLEIFGIWNRYELRFSQGKAHKAIEEFVGGVDLAEIAKGVMNREIEVYDKTNEYGAYLPDKKWQRLFGGVEPLKLTVKPEPYNLNRTIKWLVSQVSNQLVIVDEADKIMDTRYLEMIYNAGEVNERGQKVLDMLRSFAPVKEKEELLDMEV